MENRPRILVLDDELGPREALRMMLKSHYDVVTVSTGPEALDIVRTDPPDLAFLDIHMREMNGIEVLKAIKAIDARIEVVMMTAFASLETAREAMSHGVSEYLIKPFSKAEVEQAITKGLARQSETTESRQEVRALIDQMRALTDASTQGASYQDFVHSIGELLDQSLQGLKADATTLHLTQESTGRLTWTEARGCSADSRAVLGDGGWCQALSHVATTQQPVMISDSATALQYQQMAQMVRPLGYQVVVLFPIVTGDDILGMLSGFYLTPATLPAQWREIGQAYPHLFTLAIRGHQRYQESQQEMAQQSQRVAQLSILREISRVIMDNLDLGDMLEAIGEQLQSGLGYAGFHVWLCTRETSELRPVYRCGADAGLFPQTGEHVVPDDVQVEYINGAEVVSAPLVLEGQVIGAVNLVRDGQQGTLAEFEVELIHMVLESLGMAVQNSQLYGEIKETKSYLENLINDAGDAIVTVSTDDKITSWNASAERIFRFLRESAVGQDITKIFPSESYRQLRHEVLEEGCVQHLECQLTRPDGALIDCSLTLSPLHGAKDEIVGLSGIIRDITQEKQLREQLMQSEKLRAVGEMAAGVAHNFNNVLETIQGHTQLLLEFPDDAAEVEEGLQIIQKATRDAAQVVQRIQKFARGSSNAEFIETDLQELVRDTVEVTRPIWKDVSRPDASRIDMVLKLEPVPLVMSRAHEIREVVTNLIKNAAEAMPQGGILTLVTEQRGAFVFIEVSDTGSGMPDEVRQRIFDPFFSTKGHKGTGLGLSVSQTLLKGHGGDIQCQSTEGVGTTFVIKLPVP